MPDKDDDCIFKHGNVTVTSSLLTIGLLTFPISAISSFRVVTIPPSGRIIRCLGLFGVPVLLLGVLVLSVNAEDNGNSAEGRLWGWAFICLGVLSLAVLIPAKFIPRLRYRLTGETVFGLNITTTAGEKTIITSPELKTVDAIGDALRLAISKPK
jgi:hypothetical protein